MDRRQRKTREAIFNAFSTLLTKKAYTQITVGEIIADADIGRATFYSHFETKDYLLKAFCEELFCHIFDSATDTGHDHRHIFQCHSSGSVFLHLFQHLQKNDHGILTLLSSRNNDLFLSYFRANLESILDRDPSRFPFRKPNSLPDSFWKNHIIAAFLGTLKWWIDHGMQESPEVITQYFFTAVSGA